MAEPGRAYEVEVRDATAADLDALIDLYAELTEATPSAAPGDRETSSAALELTLSHPGRHLLVARLDGRVVGSADLTIVPNITHRGTPWGLVENVIVASSARRRGAGRALFAEIESRARAAGCHKVGLLSGKHRPQAHHFYRSVGYEAVAEGFKLYLDR